MSKLHATTGTAHAGSPSLQITAVDVFQMEWGELDGGLPGLNPGGRRGFVRIETDAGVTGLGEVSPMLGGLAALGVVKHDMAADLVSKDPFDQAVLQDRLFHKVVKLGPEGVGTAALA